MDIRGRDGGRIYGCEDRAKKGVNSVIMADFSAEDMDDSTGCHFENGITDCEIVTEGAGGEGQGSFVLDLCERVYNCGILEKCRVFNGYSGFFIDSQNS